MLLSARMLNNVADVNTFEVVQTFEATQGDRPDVYFQLVDASVLKLNNPAFRRYIPAFGSVLTATLKDMNTNQTIAAQCSQPFVGDKSIWKFRWPAATATFNPNLSVGTYALKLTLVEPGALATAPSAWDSGTTYTSYETVTFSSVAYLSLQNDNLAQQPDISPLWWVPLTFNPARTLVGFATQAINISLAQQEF